VLKTSSGKIRRSATRDAYLAGALLRPRPSPGRQWLRLAAADAGRAAARAAGAGAFALWSGVLVAALAPPLWVAVRLARRPRTVAALTRSWCRLVLRLAGCGPTVRGLEHAPRRSAILVANHASYLDVVALLAALPLDLRFVAKRELLAAPIVGTVLARAGHPEGTFVGRPGLLPFRLGALKAAVDAGCPVVPVAVRGTRDVLPADTRRPRPGRIEVTVLPPLTPRAGGWREIVRLRDAARAARAAPLAEARDAVSPAASSRTAPTARPSRSPSARGRTSG
jgi:fatty-acyl-CoA synthase